MLPRLKVECRQKTVTIAPHTRQTHRLGAALTCSALRLGDRVRLILQRLQSPLVHLGAEMVIQSLLVDKVAAANISERESKEGRQMPS